jgi:hypothetical protein
MKSNTSLTVAEFHQMIERLCSQLSEELRAASERMDALRGEQLPPG